MATIITQTGRAIPGHHATFGITSTDVVGAYKFHWLKNGAFIPGASSAKSYTTPPLHESDLKAKYSVKVFGQGVEEFSNELSPIPDPVTKIVEPEPAPELEPTEKEVSDALGNLLS